MLFIGVILPTKRGSISKVVKGLPADYEVEVKKADTLDDVIVVAQNIEDIIVRKTREKQMVVEKRSQAEQGGLKKKIWGCIWS